MTPTLGGTPGTMLPPSNPQQAQPDMIHRLLSFLFGQSALNQAANQGAPGAPGAPAVTPAQNSAPLQSAVAQYMAQRAAGQPQNQGAVIGNALGKLGGKALNAAKKAKAKPPSGQQILGTPDASPQTGPDND